MAIEFTFDKKVMEKSIYLPKFKSEKLSYFLLLMIYLSNLCFAQSSLTSVPQKKSLEELKGFTQEYFYSKGQELRAQKIAQFMEETGIYFQKEINFTPKTKMYILSPIDWKDYAAPPFQEIYGFPHNIDSVRLAVAAEDNNFWRSFLPNMDQLPEEMKKKITKAYRKSDGSYSMMPFFDLLALHELGHSYTSQAELKMQRHWMEELFVNIMLHTFIAEHNPELLPALETFPKMVLNGGKNHYQYTNLEDFERLYSTMGMGPKNYGWYQSKLHSSAKDIYNSGGKNVLKKLWNALKKHQENLDDQKFATMLKEEVDPVVADVYLKWNLKN